MRHASGGTLEELQKAEEALIAKGFTRAAFRPPKPLEYCLQKDMDSEECFVLIWETLDDWLLAQWTIEPAQA